VVDLKQNNNLISPLELKRLLLEIMEKRPDICFRYRLLGEMWSPNFLRILYVGEHSAMFNDERFGKLISLSDLSAIMQFEIDAPFQGFQPYFHYHVHPYARNDNS